MTKQRLILNNTSTISIPTGYITFRILPLQLGADPGRPVFRDPAGLVFINIKYQISKDKHPNSGEASNRSFTVTLPVVEMTSSGYVPLPLWQSNHNHVLYGSMW